MAKTSDKKMVIIMLSVLGGVILILLVLSFFSYRSYKDLSTKIDDLKKSTADKPTLEAEVARLEKDKEVAEKWNSESAKILPDDAGDVQDSFHRALNQAQTDVNKDVNAEEAGKEGASYKLDIVTKSYEAGKETTFNNVKRYTMKVVVDGTISQIVDFINKIESNSWLLTVDEFEIINKGADSKKVDKKSAFVKALDPKRATMYVSAYTYTETPAAAPAAKPAGKK